MKTFTQYLTESLTQAEFDALVVGDVLIRVSNGKRYVVAGTNRGITPGANDVTVQILKDGKGFGRGYTVTLDAFTLAT